MFCDQNMIFTGWVMKRYIGVLILGIIVLICLVACGSSDESSSVKDNSPAAPAQAPKSGIEKAPGGKIDTKEDLIFDMILNDEKLKKYIIGMDIIRKIYVRNRLINILIS